MSTAMTNTEIAETLATDLIPLDIVPIEAGLADEPSIGSLRRKRRSRFEDPIGVITLLDIDGVLVWEEGAMSPGTSRLRRRRAGTAAAGEVVAQLKYPRPKALGTNQITAQLEKLDQLLTPNGPSQLLEWRKNGGQWTPIAVQHPAPKGEILLIIHGTFSNSGSLLRELSEGDGAGKAPGAAFLDNASKKYTQILSFDHYTVSRSPLINAIELARLFADSNPDVIDIVCHSRGGLVARWWCEVLDRQPRKKRRVVFVGCPLGGTSLADPESIRNGLSLLSNAGRVLGSGFQLIPLLTVAGGLMKILSSIGSFAAHTPIIDASVAMIPGLASMSRIRNSPELNALNPLGGAPAPKAGSEYFAVTSDFEPDPLTWRFWREFSARVANTAADRLVFNQPNDLVVDTVSMTHHAFGPTPNCQDTRLFHCFGPDDRVHHVEYFRHKNTIAFIAECFA